MVTSAQKYEAINLMVQIVSDLSTKVPVAVRPIVLANRLPMGNYDLALIDRGSEYRGKHEGLARDKLVEVISAIRSKLPNTEAYVKPSDVRGRNN